MQTNTVADNLAPLMQSLLGTKQHRLLQDAGQAGQALGMSVYLVGGPVRDLLLSRGHLDLDLVVEGDGLEFTRVFAESLAAQYTVHEPFMTAAVYLCAGDVHVATARREVYEYPGALPTVESASLGEDLGRRDFSINTMAVALAPDRFGQLHDPFVGRQDLQAGLIRVLHDKSFLDDPTRLIRAVGFEVRFDFALERHTRELLDEAVRESALQSISAQRRTDVLLPLLHGDHAVPVLVRLGELGLLHALNLGGTISGELQAALEQVPTALEALGMDDGGRAAALVYLALLAHEAGTDVVALSEQFQMPSEDKRSLGRTLKALANPPAELMAAEITRSELYFVLQGIDAVVAAILWASGNRLVRQRLEEYWLKLREVKADVDGNDLIAAGSKPGAQFQVALAEALRAKLDNPGASQDEQLKAALDVLFYGSEPTDSES